MKIQASKRMGKVVAAEDSKDLSKISDAVDSLNKEVAKFYRLRTSIKDPKLKSQISNFGNKLQGIMDELDDLVSED